MSDCPNSTSESPTGPSPGNGPPAGGQPTASGTQSAIQSVATELRRIDDRLAEISRRLQGSGDPRGFNVPTELRSAVDCVRSDLLTDAIETLSFAATASEADLHRSSEERQRWLVAAVV